MKTRVGLILLVVAGSLIGLGCAELIVRIFFQDRADALRMNEYQEEERGKFARYDELLGWDGREDADDDFRWVDCRHHVLQNNQGYRGMEYDRQGRKGRRFVVLGDSFVWGFGVENDEIFTRVMERRAEGRIEMVNMGVSGFGTDQEYLLWTRKGNDWNPHEVILMVFLATDLWENLLSDRFDYPKPLFLIDASGELALTNVPVPRRKSGWGDPARKVSLGGDSRIRYLLGQSAFASLVLSAASRNSAIRGYLESHAIIPARLPGYEHEVPLYSINLDDQAYFAWGIFFAILDKLHNDIKRDGGRLTVVAIPSIVQVYPELWGKFLQNAGPRAASVLDPMIPGRRIGQWCERKGVRFIDLLDGLRTAGESNPNLYFPLNLHWTADGHSVVADILLKELSVDE